MGSSNAVLVRPSARSPVTSTSAPTFSRAPNSPHHPQCPAPSPGTPSRSTNLNLRETIRRQAQHISDLEARLSELLGEQTYTRTGLGAPGTTPCCREQIQALQNEIQELHATVRERDEDLGAAREAQRQLMAQTNKTAT